MGWDEYFPSSTYLSASFEISRKIFDMLKFSIRFNGESIVSVIRIPVRIWTIFPIDCFLSNIEHAIELIMAQAMMLSMYFFICQSLA